MPLEHNYKTLPPGTVLSIQSKSWQGRFIQKITGGPASHNAIVVEVPDVFQADGSPVLGVAEQAGGDVKKSRILPIDEFIKKRAKRGDRISAQVPGTTGNIGALKNWLKSNLDKPYSDFRAAISSLNWTFLRKPTYQVPSPTHSYCTEFVANAVRAGGFIQKDRPEYSLRGFLNPNSIMFHLNDVGYGEPIPVLNGGLKVPENLRKLLNPPLKKGALLLLKWCLTPVVVISRATFNTVCRVFSLPLRKVSDCLRSIKIFKLSPG